MLIFYATNMLITQCLKVRNWWENFNRFNQVIMLEKRTLISSLSYWRFTLALVKYTVYTTCKESLWHCYLCHTVILTLLNLNNILLIFQLRFTCKNDLKHVNLRKLINHWTYTFIFLYNNSSSDILINRVEPSTVRSIQSIFLIDRFKDEKSARS